MSHPAWVRELKLAALEALGASLQSHPAWVRELKPFSFLKTVYSFLSHPAWVRELKPFANGLQVGASISRTPRGCVN